MSKAAFIDLMTTNLPVAPAYFAHNAEMNRQGAGALPGDTPLPSLSGADVLAALDAGALIIDVREQEAYAAAHVAGAINIGLDGRFASWAGSLIPFGSPLVLVAGNPDDLAAARLRLARVGYDRVIGVMAADADAWAAAGLPVNRTANVAPAEAADLIAQGWQLLDVRQQREIDDAHVKGAVFMPVDRLTAVPSALDPARPTAIICGSGYRSSAAVGLMERLGFRQLASIEGGMAAWQSAGLPTVQPAIAGA
jgi:rhodanese-related sulfurtransferase